MSDLEASDVEDLVATGDSLGHGILDHLFLLLFFVVVVVQEGVKLPVVVVVFVVICKNARLLLRHAE